MPSQIDGFEYDIFISYRQKDNRGEHWVTDFIKALRMELEATFKEDVSIYFDENPLDGLLETHSVDKSLEGKLRCLVFIPILSQTYCDPKSYAWNNEFLAFNTIASKDSFGLDVKLPNGNVASRVLPVRIHEIDAQDQTILEKEIHGKARSIDFIYHAAGVNRPLRPDDDRVRDNEYKTVYRNQINKVANALKEIIGALKNHGQPAATIPRGIVTAPIKNPASNKKSKIMISVLLVVALISIYLLLRMQKQAYASPIDKSIAVLPFENMSKEPDQKYFSDGMTEETINQLTKVKELRVISRTSSMKYKNSMTAGNETIRDIARQLGVTKVVQGSVRISGSHMRIAVQLVDAETDQHLWSETYDKSNNVNSIISIQTEIALNVARKLKAILTPLEAQALQQIPTQNLEAYQLFLRARQTAQDRELESILQAISLIKKALDLDPDFTQAKCELANAYLIYKDWSYPNSFGFSEMAEQLAQEVIEKDPYQALAYSILSSVNLGNGNFKNFRLYLGKSVADDPKDVEILHRSAAGYAMLGEKDKALALIEKAMVSDPFSPIVNHNYLRVLLYNRDYVLAKQKFQEIMELIPAASGLVDIREQYQYEMRMCDSLQSPKDKTLCLIISGDTVQAKKEFKSLRFGTTKEGLILQSYFKALVNHDAHALFESLDAIWKNEKLRTALSYLKTDPVYDPYRSDPRFGKLLKEIGLED